MNASRAQSRIHGLTAIRPHVAFLGALAGAVGLASACSASSGAPGAASESSADTVGPSATCREPAGCIRADRVQIIGNMQYGVTQDGVSYTGTPKYDALRFDGVTGDNVDVLVHSATGNAYAWLLDSEFGILAFSNSDPTGATTDARIQMVLPSTGSMKYFVAFRTSTTEPATFTVTLNGPPNLTYQSTRIQQTDIDNGVYNADQLFAFADVMFGNTFTVDEGLGNALIPPLAGPNPRPNARRIHNGKFGGPDATNCIGCHNVGGADGGGTLEKNLLQDGDGVNMSSVLVRNAPALLGDGYIQQLGIEMTADLQGQLAAAKSAATGGGGTQTVALTSKGVSFGTVVVNTDGAVDFSGVVGIDDDLVVKPLGWKGRTAAIRRFVEGGFQVHLGMASQFLIAQNCKTPIPNVVGDGRDCTDPDNDGVRDEILEGQLTSMALYPALLQAPIRINPTDPTALARAANGEQLFNQVGCTSCHVQNLILNSPVHQERPDLSGGAPFVTDLTVDGRLPRLSPQSDGTVVVELWSDLKRHDMGARLADPHDTFGHAVPARLFMTRPLWGVGVTAPYLHDGRAATLQDAIAQHDGDAASVRDAFLALESDSQAQVVEFLQTLSRDPRHTDD
jgi:mono/diheme cytochrome c family protein